jgi:hypothetical protein
MMKTIVIIMMFGLVMLIACNNDNPVSSLEATDEEAIFNVVMTDNLRLSDMTILPSAMPDTLAFIANPDPDTRLYWHVVDTTIESFQVTISDQMVPSDVGMVYEASVYYTKNIQGTFNILAYNEPGDSLERSSREFSLTGIRSARCQKWGVTNQRRGWLLTEISDAHFTQGGQEFLQNLRYHCDSNDDSIFVSSLKDTDLIPRFDADEEVTLTFHIPSSADYVYVLIPEDNYYYQQADLQSLGNGNYQVVATMPALSRLYSQLRFLVIGADYGGSSYVAAGYSYNYRVR